MQGEGDLRGLVKIMASMRAVSILLVLMHLHWFCYGFFLERGWTLEVIHKILGNFDRTGGLFEHAFYKYSIYHNTNPSSEAGYRIKGA
ncbi:YWFCY domain-containing protein [Niabella aquatica]